jgi:hypothetical protein
MVMGRILGTLVAALALALTTACGSTSSSSVATDPSGSGLDPAGTASSSGPSWPPGPIDGATVLPLITVTGAGGRVAGVAAPLNTRAEIHAFAAQFRQPAMEARIRDILRTELKAPDRDVVGQVVSVGCDRPPGVDVVADQEGRVQLVPHEVASPLPECLVAVTTVAIAVLPRN